MSAPAQTLHYFPIGAEVYVRDMFLRARHCRVRGLTIWVKDYETKIDYDLVVLDLTEDEKNRISGPLYSGTGPSLVFATLAEAEAECRRAHEEFRL